MKSQKSGAMWGVSLVLIIGGAYFMTATNFLTKPLLPEAPKEDKTSQALSKDQVKQGLKQGLASNSSRKVEGEDLADAGLPKEPAIFKTKVQPYKPVPNETSTASQWYKEEGYLEKKKEEVQKKRGF